MNVRTFLREVLCRAGYSALTTANVPDAKILMKATKAKLVILGAKQQSVHGVPAKKLFEEIDISGVDGSFAPSELPPRIAAIPTAYAVGCILLAASRLGAMGAKRAEIVP